MPLDDNVFTINEENVNDFIHEGTLLIKWRAIDWKIFTADVLKIEGITQDQNLSLRIVGFPAALFGVEIRECTFINVFIHSQLKHLYLRTSTIGIDSKQHFTIKESNIEFVDIFDCVVQARFSILDNSTIHTLDVNKCQLFSGLLFQDSSVLNYFNSKSTIQHVYASKTTFENIIIESCEISDSMNFSTCTGKELYISYSTYKNEDVSGMNFFGSSSFGLKNLKIINITECTFQSNFNLGAKKLTEVHIYSSKFKALSISHSSTSVDIRNNIIENSLKIGSRNGIKACKELNIVNNDIGGHLEISGHIIRNVNEGDKQIGHKELEIGGNSLKRGKILIDHLAIEEGAGCDFQKANLENATFRKCTLVDFDFSYSNAAQATFNFCRWDEQRFGPLWRIVFRTEANLTSLNLSDLKQLQEQYANFRKSFEASSNYVDSSKFKLSEQFIRLHTLKEEGRTFNRILLKIHQGLSYFGESIILPLLWLFVSTLLFAAIFLFTGFEVYDHPIRFLFSFDPSNFFDTLCHFVHALILSLKNIIPIKMESNFFISLTEDQGTSQVLSMIQKLINIILLGSFIGALRNFLKK